MIRHAKNSVRNILISHPAGYRFISGSKSRLRYVLKPRLAEFLSQRSHQRDYRNIERQLAATSRRSVNQTAVVLHLFYTDNWQAFSEKLSNLKQSFDLFVSLPSQNAAFRSEIFKSYPDAYIFESPNRGRDVLPFIRIAGWLERSGYQYVLKLHSKKSLHRKDGDKWFRQLVSNLLPDNKAVMDKLFKALADPRTGIVGPKGEYVSLIVNFPTNRPRIAEALSNIYYPKLTDKIIRSRRQYGFFAGTMFWARMDAIKPILDCDFKVYRFDPEKGQIDATFAHALERVFSLVPEINNRDIYEISASDIKKINYKTNNIPDWSDVYIGPKPERKKPKP